MTPKEARQYIARFHLVANCPPVQYVHMSSGRTLCVSALTDEDAISVALEMQAWEKHVGTPQGATVQ